MKNKLYTSMVSEIKPINHKVIIYGAPFDNRIMEDSHFGLYPSFNAMIQRIG